MLKDKDIREPLFEFLEEAFGKVRIFEEKIVGASRADVMMVTEGALTGLEIKSDADTYDRLKSQVESYNLYFDYNIAVVGTSHAYHVREHIPQWWGIITVEEKDDGSADFYYYRKAKQNPSPVRINRQLAFLWRPELNHILEQNKMHRYEGKSKAFVAKRIEEIVEPSLLKTQICAELFERDYEKIQDVINEYRKSHGRRRRIKNSAKRIGRASVKKSRRMKKL